MKEMALGINKRRLFADLLLVLVLVAFLVGKSVCSSLFLGYDFLEFNFDIYAIVALGLENFDFSFLVGVGLHKAVLQRLEGLEQIIRALAVAGLIGTLTKTNASISGAECGCQAEIGSACSMAAAALGELFGMGLGQIEYAAEIAFEHHLGLTCDPIKGLVQIPCIERNAVAAMRAINAVNLANFLTDTRNISFDLIVKTMYETGRDLSKIYRETGEGGLAKLYL